MSRRRLTKTIGSKIKDFQPFSITTVHSQQCQSLNVFAQKVTISLNQIYLKKKIQRLLLTGGQAECGALSSSQVNEPLRLFILNKRLNQQKKWFSPRFKQRKQYDVYINANITKAEGLEVCTQQSISFPFILAQIERFKKIEVQYNNLQGETKKETIEGFKAFAFQQCWDYSVGRHLLDWRAHRGNLRIQQDVQNQFKKTSSVLQQYCKQIEGIEKEFFDSRRVPQKVEEGNIDWLKNRGFEQQISIQQDYIRRIRKHYRKQILLFLERAQLNII